MSITSFKFIVFFIVSLVIYYCLPKKIQWVVLLCDTIVFFVLASSPKSGLFIIISILATTIGAICIDKAKENEKKGLALFALLTAMCINLLMLVGLKYLHINIKSVWIPLGISYYTLQALGYLLDVYWGMEESQKNIFKMGLFIGYYPQLVSGPISRYSQMKDELFQEHKFEWKNITYGMQRMLWGFFKKLVLSARLGIMVDTIYGKHELYQGLYVWMAAFLFMLQLYTDFSGCIDIVIGASECYGIKLPENFNTPFFSKTVQEFWQRWHMTLGFWMKDYVMYPILKSKLWSKMSKAIKPVLGKKASRQIPSFLGMLIVWFLIGLWHGGAWKYVLGSGIWFWFWIVLEQLIPQKNKKENFSWNLLCNLKVFVVVSIGNMFFRLSSIKETLYTMKLGFRNWNPYILFDGSIYKLGLSEKNVRLTIVSLVVLLLVSVLQQKKDVRDRLSEQNIVFRWLILFLLLFAVIIFGQYGPGYDAQAFIYQVF